MTQPGVEPPAIETVVEPMEPVARRHRLVGLPAIAVAAMLVAGGLLMAIGGMARLAGPAPATPTPTVVPSSIPGVSPAPTPLPATPTLGPSPSPFGVVGPRPPTARHVRAATRALIGDA